MKENRTDEGKRLGFFFLKLDFWCSASTNIVTALNYLVADLVVEFGDCSVVLHISPTVSITQQSFGRLWQSIKQAVICVPFM